MGGKFEGCVWRRTLRGFELLSGGGKGGWNFEEEKIFNFDACEIYGTGWQALTLGTDLL